MLIIFENSLDPYQDQQKFGPDDDLDLKLLSEQNSILMAIPVDVVESQRMPNYGGNFKHP